MIRHCFYLLVSFLWLATIAPHAHAQKIEWSAYDLIDKKMGYVKIIGYDDAGFFALASNLSLEHERSRVGFKKRKYYLMHFTNGLKKSWEKPLEINANRTIEKITWFNESIILISSEEDAKNSKYTLWLDRVDQKGNIVAESIRLDEFNTTEYGLDEDLILIASHEQTYLLISYGTVRSDNEKQTVRVVVTDETFSKTKIGDIAIPIGKKNYTAENYAVANDGKVYVLGTRYDNEKKARSPEQYFYQLLMYDPFTQITFQNEIKITDQFISDIGFSIDELNKQVVIAGFFSDKTSYSTAGVYYMAYDPATNKITERGSQKFSERFMLKFIGEPKVNKGKELVNYSVNKIVLRNDGGAVVTAESFYTSRFTYYDNFTHAFTTRTNYYYNNVLAISINVDGTIDWEMVVPKEQFTVDDGGFFSSYATLIFLDKMYFIYNKFSGRRTAVMVHRVSTTGEDSQSQIIGPGEDAQLIPRSGMQIDENIVVIPALRNRKLVFLKLEF